MSRRTLLRPLVWLSVLRAMPLTAETFRTSLARVLAVPVTVPLGGPYAPWARPSVRVAAAGRARPCAIDVRLSGVAAHGRFRVIGLQPSPGDLLEQFEDPIHLLWEAEPRGGKACIGVRRGERRRMA